MGRSRFILRSGASPHGTRSFVKAFPTTGIPWLSRIRASVATTPALAILAFALGAAPAAHAQVTYKLGFDGANPPSAEYMRRVNELLPPQPEFFLAPRWPGVAGSPKVVTWSFIPDGVNIPTVLGENAGVSSLFARMDSLYAGQGGRATWVSRIQSCFDRWEELSGIDFVRIQAPGVDWDDGAAWGTLGSATRGDIRVAMKRLDGPGGVTIVGAFPGNGDIVLDRLDAWDTPADANRFLRNQMMWAQGIACGIDLSCPNDGTKLMEPVIPLSFDGPRQDDIRAAQRHYGDVNELDDSIATATSLGAIAVGNSLSLGALPPPLVADLALELIAPDGTTVLASASSTGRGAAESILLAPLNSAGTYFVRVFESGSVASSQLYSLEVSISACTLDSDGDGAVDCVDACPLDPAKVAPGLCGCGGADTDSDGDTTPDCNDLCPNDAAKTAPGACGCGVADTDSDGDSTPNCIDGCPSDPTKIAPGVCGCGVSDADNDGDGTPNCNDLCPNDPAKLAPGVCGCGVADADSDGDGTLNCLDGCPNDPAKLTPGVCGCGVSDVDTDGDGAADCVDNCPSVSNPFQEDADGDQRGDVCDNCVNHPNPGQENCDGDAQGDVCEIALGLEIDCDQNGVPDNCEPDCNGNGQVDACDILLGSSLDSNLNQIPDDCEAPCPAIQTYCTAKLNSNGCLPSMGWSGTPSLSAGSGFIINCTLAIPDRSWQLFYGYAASFSPFQGGFVCVRPPLRRTVVQQSVGVGPCGGVFSFDYNVWLAGSFDTNLTAGTNVFARWWMRDPQASFTTGFSNALTFTVCP